MADADDDEYLFNQNGMRRAVKSIRWTEGQPKNIIQFIQRQSSGGKDVRGAMNGSGQTINPFDLVAITSPSVAVADGSDFFAMTARVTQASTSYSKQYGIVVGPPADSEEHTQVSFDGGPVRYQGSAPTEGARVGPVPGSFAVSSTAPPYFTVIGISTQFSLVDVVPYQPPTISPVSLASPLANNASANVTLSDGRVVSGQNKSGQLLPAGNAMCVADPHSGSHYITGSASPSTSGSTATGPRFYAVTLSTGGAYYDSGVVSVGSAISLSDGTTAVISSVDNGFGCAGASGDLALVMEAPGIGFTGYSLINVHRDSRFYVGSLASNLLATSSTGTISEPYALDGGPSSTGVSGVVNPLHRWGDTGDTVLVVEDRAQSPVEYIVVGTVAIGQKLGKTDSSINKAASGTVSIWSGTPGSESDTGDNVTAYNRFADVGSGKWVWVANNGLGWYIVSAECPLT